ncbi:GTPase Era, mitochondrial [Helicoverpa zea]|uniref:GTPase Era, mitochondrial n=1 Tax=Helicoverpa zea TaxID=7113 RepID=UPI001F590F29|nr:GTPase Era, mitochondrial [Helicoverpa zea]
MTTFVLSALRLTHRKHTFKALFYSTQPERANERNLGKIVNVAIIGAPNSGKSTLINKVTERKICAASNKVHTTTKLVRAMCFYNDTQIVFLDTPGVVTEREQKKYNLPESMIKACHKSLRCADVVGVVHDVSNKYTKDYLHSDVINMLNFIAETPSFLIINKIDKFKSKAQLLSTISSLTNGFIAGNPIPGSGKSKSKDKGEKKPEKGYSKFSDVFLISALNGDGVQDIKNYLVSNAKTANFQYSPSQWTDQRPESLIEEAVRAKFLDFLAQEIPYKLNVQLEYYEEIEEQDKILCSVAVECPNERLVRLIAGAGGGRLQQIKTHIRNDLVDLFKKTVVLSLSLKIKSKNEAAIVN